MRGNLERILIGSIQTPRMYKSIAPEQCVSYYARDMYKPEVGKKNYFWWPISAAK